MREREINSLLHFRVSSGCGVDRGRHCAVLSGQSQLIKPSVRYLFHYIFDLTAQLKYKFIMPTHTIANQFAKFGGFAVDCVGVSLW